MIVLALRADRYWLTLSARTALTRFLFNVILQTKPCTGEVFTERRYKMLEVKVFTTLQTITESSVEAGDEILATEQRVAERMEMRCEFSTV